MKRVAVFGNAGGGKSTLAKRLAELTQLPLYPLDMIQFRVGSDKVAHKVPHDEYLKAHADLLCREAWIIDGFGCVASAWERFSAADTLIYVDLPLLNSLQVGDQALHQGTLRAPGRLAREKPHVEQHDQQLSRAAALPPQPDPQVPAACRGRSRLKARSPPEVACANPVVPGSGQAGSGQEGARLSVSLIQGAYSSIEGSSDQVADIPNRR